MLFPPPFCKRAVGRRFHEFLPRLMLFLKALFMTLPDDIRRLHGRAGKADLFPMLGNIL